jgi:hypothetical protein
LLEPAAADGGEVLQPGEREQMHSHPAFVTYIVSGSKIRNHFADGQVVEAEFNIKDALWREPQTHWIENVGTTTCTSFW